MTMHELALIAAGGAAFLSSLGMLTVLVPLLHRWQVLDHPNHRSSHDVVTPRGGGLAVAAGCIVGGGVSLTLVAEAPIRELLALAGSSIVLALVGLRDDLGGLRARTRLAAQAAIGIAVALSLASIGDHQAGIVIGLLAIAGAVYFVGVVNAVNFMDGVNGISGLTGLVAGMWYASIGIAHDDRALAIGGLALSGACLGFLPWNAPRARVFMGDAGSYGLGALVGTMSLITVLVHADPVAAVAPLSVYLADTSITLVRRWRAGQPLAVPHRDHAYQRLVDRGWSHSQAAMLAALTAALVCFVAGMLPLVAAVPIAVLALACYVWLPNLLRTTGVRI